MSQKELGKLCFVKGFFLTIYYSKLYSVGGGEKGYTVSLKSTLLKVKIPSVQMMKINICHHLNRKYL